MRIVDSIAAALATGSAPGKARQVGQTWVFGGAPKVVGQPQNIFELVPSSTWVSRPSTGSNLSNASSYGMSVGVSAMLITQSFNRVLIMSAHHCRKDGTFFSTAISLASAMVM